MFAFILLFPPKIANRCSIELFKASNEKRADLSQKWLEGNFPLEIYTFPMTDGFAAGKAFFK